MQLRKSQAMFLPLCLIGGLVGGCGDEVSGPRGSLSGKVTFEGKPVAAGYLNILPADGNGATQATEIVDGEYSVSGVAVGKKKLLVQVGSDSATKVYSDPGGVKGEDPNKSVPSNAVGNNQEIEIKVGSQTADLTLKRPSGGKP